MTKTKEQIMQKLSKTEQHYTVKIPLAIESGRRGWGFASPDSDYDCRFIYVHKKDWYLSILDKKDFIEYSADNVFDINGWDLKKVLHHIIKSNAVMFEWLSSNEIYIRNDYVTSLLQGLAKDFFNPVAVSYHYVSIAKNKLAETDVPLEILSVINELTEVKSVSDESYKIKQNKLLIKYFERELEIFTTRLNEIKFEKNRDYEKANAVFRKIIERMWTNES